MQGIYAILILIGYVNGQLDTDVDRTNVRHDFALNAKFPIKLPAVCSECSCPSKPRCEIGVTVVTDGCGCCQICARQLGERCDARNVCDHHKGLHCDDNTGTCKAPPGRSCHVADQWYENGALFSPTCRITCFCTDGDVACKVKCKPAPPGCRNPKRVRSSSNCCWQWRCADRSNDERAGRSKSSTEIKVPCKIQRTEWTSCSATCGYGVSERYTNQNEQCKIMKEERLCIVRPCKSVPIPHRKSKRSCRKTFRQSMRTRLRMRGCVSLKTFKPKYCGTCRNSNKCCQPHSTKTVNVDFRCENPDGSYRKTTKKMMIIQNCKCGHYCSTSENDIFFNNLRSMRNELYLSRR